MAIEIILEVVSLFKKIEKNKNKNRNEKEKNIVV
jgi:hypothetical protein